ncbi:MAG: DUF3794 domain-containing protein [Clostridia bacterium]|nr:DUF3794 domain-containing protein [Clostridia bacterium]
MEVETNKETLCINQIIGQKIDSAIIEEDFVVPDIKPDIINEVSTNGTVCIYKKEVMDGKIKIDGCINAYVIYLADDEQSQVRSINTNLDFSQTIDFKELKIGMTVQSNICIKSIECRVLNGRKVNVRAILDIDLKAYSNEELEFMKQVEGIKDIQLLNENFNINSLLGIGSTKVYAKDTVVIDNIDEIAEIMKVNVDIQNKETKISYNKVLIKADQIIKIMYLSLDNRICTKVTSIPIMGFVDMQDVNDENICDVDYEIKNILIKPNSAEEHSIYVEIENEVTCIAYQNKNLSIIQDLYSPSINLAYKQKMIKTMSQKSVIKDICLIREKQVIPEIGNNKIYDVDVRPYILSQNIVNDRVIYKGEIELKFVFGEENSTKIQVKAIIIPFEYNVNCPKISSNFKIDSKLEVKMQDFVIMPDQSIDIKIDLQFVVSSFRNEEISVIQEINIEENRENEKYSIIIYFTKPRRYIVENS